MIKLSSEQSLAVDMVSDISNRIVVVTGGAGTGKTTIMREAHDELKAQKLRVSLCAPTGRAAKRIQEATGIDAKTIHRLLEFPAPLDIVEGGGKVEFGKPKRNEWNPLECDVLLIDEASMIAFKLNNQLISAMPTHSCIRYFGDANQLPPIDDESKGKSVFERMLDEKPTVRLSYNFRSGDNLIENANRILRGQIPQRGDKFEIIVSNDPLSALREIAGPEYHTTDHQVLTPKRINKMGAVHLSSVLRTKFNLYQDKPRIQLARFDPDEDALTVLQDDKVLWTKNDYCLNIMNGELGIVEAIDDGSLSIVLDDNRHVIVPPSIRGPFGNLYDPRKQIDLAYCMTTHKAQGSEFDTVIYVMSRSQVWMLNRNNFYTGVTRAKQKVLVICDRQSMTAAMRRPRR